MKDTILPVVADDYHEYDDTNSECKSEDEDCQLSDGYISDEDDES